MRQTDLSDARIREALLPYGIAADSELCDGVRVYIEVLLRWNEKVSLTTVTNPDEILRTHFGESFFSASAAGIGEGRVADIGTGPGFPGIPLRMVRKRIKLTLVEPVAKKTAFLGEILRNLAISDATIIRCRMEEFPGDLPSFDVITARALGKYEAFLHWSKTRISKNGSIMLLLGESDTAALFKDRRWVWREPVQIPQSKGRFILLGSAPRNAGI